MEHVVKIPAEQELEYNPETRARNDVETLFAEMLDGAMCTPFEYTYDPATDILTAEDGGDVDKIFKDAHVNICKIVEKNPNAGFEKRRNELELGELEDMHAMMRGELGNTMVVISDFPEELKRYPKDYMGYNVTRQQTMMRVFVRDENKLKMFTQSLDQSYRLGLEAIYRELKTFPTQGELLGQRIHIDLSEAEQLALLPRLLGVYDSVISAKTGTRHHAGIEIKNSETSVDTYDFVKKQEDIVALAVAEVLASSFDDEKLYKTVALLEERLERFRAGEQQKQAITYVMASAATPEQFAIQYSILQEERNCAGMRANQNGKGWSACGKTIESSDGFDSLDQHKKAGYTTGEDSSDNETDDWDYDDIDFCVECQTPPDEGDAMKKVGPCKICEECVNTKHGGKK